MKSVVPDVQLLAAYIDNYKGAGSPETAQRAAETLLVVAAQYRVTMNMEASAASAFEFRGIEFGIAHGGGLYATVSNKTRLKLAHAATNIGRITEWSMNELEQTFGLLAYVSYAMQLPLYEYYTVFKFIRRRFRLLSSRYADLNIQRTDPARVRPCSVICWQRWLQDIGSIVANGRRRKSQVDAKYILFTDASCSGYGGIAFATNSHSVTTISGAWETCSVSLLRNNNNLPHINELEAWTMMHAAEHLIPPNAAVSIIVDNTTAIAATTKTRSSNFNINNYIKRLLRHATVRNIKYIASASNPADNLSRGHKTNWQLLVESLKGHMEMASASGAVQPQGQTTP